MRAADNLAVGMSSEAARIDAQKRFGNTTLLKEDTRAVDIIGWLDECARDFRYALRMLQRSPGFTAVAVLTLALGIGANTAIFSVVDAILLRPLPYPEPERLVRVWESSIKHDSPRNVVNPLNFLDWHDHAQSFESMAAISGLMTNLSSQAFLPCLVVPSLQKMAFRATNVLLSSASICGNGSTARNQKSSVQRSTSTPCRTQ